MWKLLPLIIARQYFNPTDPVAPYQALFIAFVYMTGASFRYAGAGKEDLAAAGFLWAQMATTAIVTMAESRKKPTIAIAMT